MSSSECRFGLDVLLRLAFAFWAWDPRYSERSKRVLLLFGFFFFTRFRVIRLLFMQQCMNSNRKCWLFSDEQWFVHCSRTHKFHFSATFSLKMGLTVLFTHLKNILLQYFQFQFSVSAKISSIQTDPEYLNIERIILTYILYF